MISLFTLSIALACVAGGLWALVKQKPVVDENGNLTAVDLPLFGKVQTNYPSLVSIFLGTALCALVVQKSDVTVDQVQLEANMTVGDSLETATLFAGAVPMRYTAPGVLSGGDEHRFNIDVDKSGIYNVFAFALVGLENNRPVYYGTQGRANWDSDRSMLYFKGKIGD